MVKTVSFPKDLADKVQEAATRNRRSFSSQVVYMVEAELAALQSQQARDLAEAIEAAR